MGATVHHQSVEKVTLSDPSGFSLTLSNYGATLLAIHVPDAHGHIKNVLVGPNCLEDLLDNPACMGATIGRTAGRTQDARFSLQGQVVELDHQHHPHGLHGGPLGWQHQLWEWVDHSENHVVLRLDDPAQEGKTPGNLKIEMEVRLTGGMAFELTYTVVSDQATYVNPTNHAYFNLSNDQEDVQDHLIVLKADHVATLNHQGVPTGVMHVSQTPFDLRQITPLRTIFESHHPSILGVGQGLDHPFKLMNEKNQMRLYDPHSKREMVVTSNQPYVVVYSGNWLHHERYPSGRTFTKYQGICFETQDLPNGPNIGSYRQHYLEPHVPYRHVTRYAFSNSS